MNKIHAVLIYFLFFNMIVLKAQHCEDFKVNGRKIRLYWEYSIPLFSPQQLVLFERNESPNIIIVKDGIWDARIAKDSAYYYNLIKTQMPIMQITELVYPKPDNDSIFQKSAISKHKKE